MATAIKIYVWICEVFLPTFYAEKWLVRRDVENTTSVSFDDRRTLVISPNEGLYQYVSRGAISFPKRHRIIDTADIALVTLHYTR